MSYFIKPLKYLRYLGVILLAHGITAYSSTDSSTDTAQSRGHQTASQETYSRPIILSTLNTEQLAEICQKDFLAKQYFDAQYSCKLAANREVAEAEYLMGQINRIGLEKNVNIQKALYWYDKSARRGHTKAQFLTGVSYFHGLGRAKNFKTALDWFERAAEGGHVDSLNYLGALHLFSYTNAGVSNDIRYKNSGQSKGYFEESLAKGNKRAYCGLGSVYYHGTGVKKNTRKAYQLFMKGAKNGSAICQLSLTALFFSGDGAHRDYAKAYGWLIALELNPNKAELASMQNAYDVFPSIRFILEKLMSAEQIKYGKMLGAKYKKYNQNSKVDHFNEWYTI